MRDATPAGTTAVFARALESATPCWQAVQPGEVLVDDDVLGASVAVARERPEFLVLAFAILGDEARALGTRAGVRIITPAPAALDQTLVAEASAADPRVVVVRGAG